MAASNKKDDATLEYEAALKATADALKAVVDKEKMTLYLSSKHLDFCKMFAYEEGLPNMQLELNERLPVNIKVNLEDDTWQFTARRYSGFYQSGLDNFINTNKQLFK